MTKTAELAACPFGSSGRLSRKPFISPDHLLLKAFPVDQLGLCRDPFLESAMKFRFRQVHVEIGADDRSDGLAKRQLAGLVHRGSYQRQKFVVMHPLDFENERILVGKILVERADADTGPFRNLVGRRRFKPMFGEYLPGSFQDGFNHEAGPQLFGFPSLPGGQL